MDYLNYAPAKLTAVMMIGMAGMFLAPSVMIISKFVTLKAFIDTIGNGNTVSLRQRSHRFSGLNGWVNHVH